MSKRERILALTVIALIVLFALDQFALRPLMDRYEQINVQASQLEEDLRSARVLLDNRAAIEQRWRDMAEAGLTNGASTQRIEVQQRLTQWAEAANFNLATVSTGQTTVGEYFHETRFLASGSGSMEALATFLAHLEQSDYPLRIIESDVTSRSDRGNDLSLRLTLSTIRRAVDGDAPGSATQFSEGRP